MCLLYRYRTSNRRPLTIQGAGLAVGAAWLIAYGTATARAIAYLVSPFRPRMVNTARALLHAMAVDYLPMSRGIGSPNAPPPRCDARSRRRQLPGHSRPWHSAAQHR